MLSVCDDYISIPISGLSQAASAPPSMFTFTTQDRRFANNGRHGPVEIVQSGNSIDKGVRAGQLSCVYRFACEKDFLVADDLINDFL